MAQELAERAAELQYDENAIGVHNLAVILEKQNREAEATEAYRFVLRRHVQLALARQLGDEHAEQLLFQTLLMTRVITRNSRASNLQW